MNFSIRAFHDGGPVSARCELQMGSDIECYPLVTTLWSIDKYRKQWRAALTAMVTGRVTSCVLVTDIKAPEVSFGIMCWLLYREGDCVYLREHMGRGALGYQLVGDPVHVEPNIPRREHGTNQEQHPISEWVVTLDDIQEFIRSDH